MTLLAALPGAFASSSGGAVRWTRWDGGDSRLLDARAAHALSWCATFQPREAHIDRLRAQGHGALAAAQFDALRRDGLVVGLDWFLHAAPRAREAVPEPLIVIRVFERPQGLRRLLDSLLADEQRFDVARRYVLVDDTQRAACAEATMDLARSFARASRSEVRVLGPPQRAAALATLGSAGSALRELLDPALPSAITGSRTWNWAVLLSAGRSLSILDDDVCFPLRLADAAEDGMDVADSTEAVLRFFDDDGYVRARALERDPYAYLRDWLGRGAADTMRAAATVHEDALRHREASELLFVHENAPVLGVVPGLYGGIAFNSSAYLLYSNPASQASLWREPFRLARLQGDALWHGYPRARVASHAVYTPLLLDNRLLLPYAGTWGRVDDTYFLSMLRAIAGSIAFAHVPAMLGHMDLAPRTRLERTTEPLLLDRNAGVAHWIAANAANLNGSDRRTRLLDMAARADRFAAAGDGEIADFVRAFRRHMIGRLLQHLERALTAHPQAPEDWRALVARTMAVNRAALTQTVAPEEVATVRRALRQIATLSETWIAAWSAIASDDEAWRDLTQRV
jgi:hypothetical protein